jgi:hypothetical protein
VDNIADTIAAASGQAKDAGKKIFANASQTPLG